MMTECHDTPVCKAQPVRSDALRHCPTWIPSRKSRGCETTQLDNFLIGQETSANFVGMKQLCDRSRHAFMISREDYGFANAQAL